MNPEVNRVYVGDCIEVMRSWPEKCVDIIVTDPPYGISYQGNMRREKFRRIDGDDRFPTEIFPELFRLAKGGGYSCFVGGTTS